MMRLSFLTPFAALAVVAAVPVQGATFAYFLTPQEIFAPLEAAAPWEPAAPRETAAPLEPSAPIEPVAWTPWDAAFAPRPDQCFVSGNGLVHVYPCGGVIVFNPTAPAYDIAFEVVGQSAHAAVPLTAPLALAVAGAALLALAGRRRRGAR